MCSHSQLPQSASGCEYQPLWSWFPHKATPEVGDYHGNITVVAIHKASKIINVKVLHAIFPSRHVISLLPSLATVIIRGSAPTAGMQLGRTYRRIAASTGVTFQIAAIFNIEIASPRFHCERDLVSIIVLTYNLRVILYRFLDGLQANGAISNAGRVACWWCNIVVWISETIPKPQAKPHMRIICILTYHLLNTSTSNSEAVECIGVSYTPVTEMHLTDGRIIFGPRLMWVQDNR